MSKSKIFPVTFVKCSILVRSKKMGCALVLFDKTVMVHNLKRVVSVIKYASPAF